jgi:transcriptional regulator GlxA family with amidase domain
MSAASAAPTQSTAPTRSTPPSGCTEPTRHRVAVLALDGVVAFDLGTPPQVFGAARDAAGHPLYEVRVATPGAAPVRSAAGFTVGAEHGLEALGWADTVVVAGIEGARAAGPFPAEVLQGLTGLRGDVRLVSICTGAFVLAAAGLLDGRPATTHWFWADLFRELHPQVRLDPDVLFVDDGDVLTSAGVAAGVDLCLHLVRQDHGAEVANRAARRSVVPPWRAGGQAQFIERPVPAGRTARTAAAREWALAHLGDPLDLAGLAARSHMSVRTFTRHFREETGQSPGRWLGQQRVDHARRLLETTDLPVDQVARQSGFGTAAAFRAQMAAAVGVPPSAYRATFRATG